MGLRKRNLLGLAQPTLPTWSMPLKQKQLMSLNQIHFLLAP